MQLRRRVKFQEAYGELLPFVDDWRSIGILIEVPLHIIKKIADGGQTDSCMCLAEVLEWLENNYTLTWKKFNDIVEKLKTAKAEKIH